MTEVVAALIWEGDRFLACQRPAHKARGLLTAEEADAYPFCPADRILLQKLRSNETQPRP